MARETYRDLSSGETRTGVQPDSVSTSTSVDLDLTSVRLEVGSGVLGRDSTLDGEPSLGDRILGQSKGRERSSSSNLDLSGDDVDSGDFLCKTHAVNVSKRGLRDDTDKARRTGDSVLDLNSRVNFDEVVPALLIDQKLCGTSVSVLHSVGELDGIVQDSLTGFFGKMRSRSDFDNLWITVKR